MSAPTDHSGRRARAALPEHVDVAIIGAGLGGLSAGAYLAQSGYRVAILDAHYVAGGCATQFQRRGNDGMYRFDVGLHYIGDCGPDGAIPTVLREVGGHVDFIPLDPDGFDEFVFPDFRFRVPADLDRYRDRLAAMFPSDVRGIDRYVELVRQVSTIGREVEKHNGKLGFGTALKVLLSGRLLARYQNATIAEFLDTCTQNPQLRAVMLGQHGDYGVPSREVSAMLHAGLAAHYFGGAYYPVGGGQRIADELALAIERHGGTIHLRHPVQKILVEDGRAVGVRTEPRHGEQHEIRANVVLSNADIKRTLLEMLGPEHLPSELVTRTQNYQMGGALFMTFLGVRGAPAALGLRPANIWQFDGYDSDAMYARARSASDVRTYGAYITSASAKDPSTHTHAPAGITNVEVMSVVPGQASAWGATEAEAIGWKYRREADYQALRDRIEGELVDRFERLFPAARGNIVYRESASPLTQTRFTRASDGTSYGIAATPAQFMQKRPGYRGPVGGLYLCGASTRAGHGIVGAMQSGRQAARRIAADAGRELTIVR